MKPRIVPPYLRLAAAAALLLAASCSEPPRLSRLGENAVILAFGNSLTRGTGAASGEDYPAILSALSGRRVINAGVPGEVSRDGVRRLPALLDQHEPALLILCHGGNDLLRRQDPGAAAANVERMVRMAQERGIAVMLVGVPAPGLFLSAADFYADIAQATGALYLADTIAEVLGDAALKSDPVHPNATGYRRIAEQVHETLVQAGALP